MKSLRTWTTLIVAAGLFVLAAVFRGPRPLANQRALLVVVAARLGMFWPAPKDRLNGETLRCSKCNRAGRTGSIQFSQPDAFSLTPAIFP